MPVISCFVGIKEENEKETDDFNKTDYILHILPTIYPDKDKSIKENSIEMAKKDYEQKKKAYEDIYNEELIYEFKPQDIAGWRENAENREEVENAKEGIILS